MFFKSLKNKLLVFLLLFMLIPTSVFAYSDYIIAGGENIGIELSNSGIIVVGTYQIDKENPAKNAGINIGDNIIAISGTKVETIEAMIEAINKNVKNDMIDITYLRNNKSYTTTLKLVKDEASIYKTGLYVKDSISGVGTLTFIDPNTKLYGALGHEIIEKTTGQKLEIKDGKIYKSTVTSITPSSNGSPGEKNARYDTSVIYGNVKENTTSGVFGNYTDVIPNKKEYKVANPNEIKTGDATILTVLKDEEVEEFDINILRINNTESKIKNILFEITDEYLLKETGGIVQGMSGSPIIQDDKIIGAVTHVVVNDTTKGYGIFITTMLEEAEN